MWSLYEVSDLLLGDHLCGKSKTIKWVDVSQPHNRKRRLINHSRLVEMNEQNPNSTAIFEDNAIDAFCPQRPTHMEEVCLYDFVADYVKCGVDKDGNIVYRKFNKSVLPNHRVYNPNKENYFYSLLLLFVPFRNEEDLIEEGESAEDAFDRHMEQNDALNIYSEKLQRKLKANENVQKINEARQAEQEDVTVPAICVYSFCRNCMYMYMYICYPSRSLMICIYGGAWWSHGSKKKCQYTIGCSG